MGAITFLFFLELSMLLFVFLFLLLSRGSLSISTTPKCTLFDVPVSNNGARCRLILYKKNISEDEVQIVSPVDIGGLKSEKYLAMNPQGKMPCLIVNSSIDEKGACESIPESDTICRYLMSTYSSQGPSFQPESYKSNLIARIHDMYLTTIQGCLYKATPPFGIYQTRSKAIKEFQKQLVIINDLVSDDGLYLTGSEVSLADATLFPTMVFAKFMLPKFGESPELPAKIEKWYNSVIAEDSDFARVNEEVNGALKAWDSGGRWDPIIAEYFDEEPTTIFDKIIGGEIPASIVHEDDDVLAFKDINPAAPAHVLVIPKVRSNLSCLRKSSPEHVDILGKLLVVAGELSKDKTLGFEDGARIVINDGSDAGQEVSHLHVHVLGGRKLAWPPG